MTTLSKPKQLLSALVALIMAVAMTVVPVTTASAAENDDSGTITINNAVSGETYSVYQIAVLESYSGDNYAYTVAEDWEDFFTDSEYVTVTDGYVTWTGATTAADYEAFAKAALAYAQENDIEATDSGTASGTSLTFSDLNLGWYLVDSSLGALCMLDTTNPTANINEKNTAPSIGKEVVESEGNDPSVGDSVSFKITVTAQKGAESYVVHDIMSDGLDFDAGSVKVTVSGSDLDSSYYSVVTTDLDDGCTFEIHFIQSYLDTITDATEIVITYSATINANAVEGVDPETNEAKLTYGDDSSTTTTTATKTYVYYFDLVKTDTSNVLISGAEFKLYESEDGDTAIQFVYSNGTYRVATAAEIEAEDTTTTDTIVVTDGKVRISGLGAGTYYLEETAAPDGYNKLTSRVDVTVNSNNAATVTTDSESGVTTYTEGGKQIENNSGSLLPSTGGMGTTVLYAVGALLVIGAGVALVVRLRNRHEC